MDIEIMELYREYLDILIRKKKKRIKFDEVEKKFIEAIEKFDNWFVRVGVNKYL